MTGSPATADPTPRRLLALSLPAIAVGMLASLVLWLLDEIAQGLEVVLWDALPGALGADPDSGLWIFAVLTGIGIAVGLLVWVIPGHGGPDSATIELSAPVQPLSTLPSIAVATVLTLAGGVSLGPEGPIIVINTALVVWVLAKIVPAVPTQLSAILAVSATIGALFGTPVAAALVLTGAVAATPGLGSLWDRLFLPLAAASAGAFTTVLLGGGIGAVPGIDPADGVDLVQVLWAFGIAVAAAAIGMLAAIALPRVHRGIRVVLRHPFLVPAVGGVLLGVLGAIGGPLTLFKGLDQSAELVANAADYTPLQLVVIIATKLVALVVAAAFAFRGGRIFPGIFLGVAAGVLAAALIPGMPLSLALAAGVLGFTLAIARDGWIAIFSAAAIVGDMSLLPVICVLVLPAWLVVARGPEMIVHSKEEPVPAQ